jgi:hypothetical protein
MKIKQRKIFNVISIITICLLFISYFLFFKSNIPVVDDYWYLHDFTGFLSASTLKEKLQPLFIVRNSHRCIPLYILGYLQILLWGKINLDLMLWVGFLSLFGIILIFNKVMSNNWYLSSSIIPFIFFSFTPQLYSVIFFPLVSIQLVFTFLLITIFFYLLTYQFKPKIFPLILFLAITITFSNGNGMGIWLAGFLIMILYPKKYTVKYRIVFMVAGISAILFYFINFNNEGVRPTLKITINYILKVLVFIPSFLGNAVDFFPNFLFSEISKYDDLFKIITIFRIIIIIGFGLWAIIKIGFLSIFQSLIQKKLLNQPRAFAFGIFSYIMLSNLLAAVFRAQETWGMGLSIRYKLYGSLVILITIIWMADQWSLKKLYLGGLFYFVISWITYFEPTKVFTNDLNVSYLNIKNSLNTYIHFGYGEVIDNMINQEIIPSAKKSHVVDFREYWLDDIDILNPINDSPKIEMTISNNNLVIKTDSKLFNSKMLVLEKLSLKQYLPLKPKNKHSLKELNDENYFVSLVPQMIKGDTLSISILDYSKLEAIKYNLPKKLIRKGVEFQLL